MTVLQSKHAWQERNPQSQQNTDKVVPIDNTNNDTANGSSSGDGCEVVPLPDSTAPTMPQSNAVTASRRLLVSSGHNATWQWEHRTGWRDYEESVNQRIEKAYQDGFTFVRLKCGKNASTPMELFFVDKIQFDPMTNHTRAIRRIGANPLTNQVRQKLVGLVHSIETGKPRQVKYSSYRKERQGIEIKEQRLAKGAVRALSRGLSSVDDKSNLQEPVSQGRVITFCRRVIDSQWFFPFTMMTVSLNAIWIGYEADHNDVSVISDADAYVRIVENAFCSIFFVELLVRFLALPKKRYFFRDRWFLFDLLLVILMVGELWILPIVIAMSADSHDSSKEPDFRRLSVLRIARLLRLARLGRIARLLRIFPEVMTLLKGIVQATRSVFFTLLLLLMLVFTFAVGFRSRARGTDAETIFPSVGMSMWILLMKGVFLDDPSDTLNEILETSKGMTMSFVGFIFLASFTVLNMLIGILCDVVHGVSKKERDAQEISNVKRSLLELLECYDEDNDQRLTANEFDVLLLNPELHLICKNFGVDAIDLQSLKDVLFDGKGKQFEHVEFEEFIEVVIRLRNGNNAHVMDIVDLREYVRERVDRLESGLECPMPAHATHACINSISLHQTSNQKPTFTASQCAATNSPDMKLSSDPTKSIDEVLSALEGEEKATKRLPTMPTQCNYDDGRAMLHNFLSNQAAWQEYFAEVDAHRWQHHEEQQREFQAKQDALVEQVANIQTQLQQMQAQASTNA